MVCKKYTTFYFTTVKPVLEMQGLQGYKDAEGPAQEENFGPWTRGLNWVRAKNSPSVCRILADRTQWVQLGTLGSNPVGSIEAGGLYVEGSILKVLIQKIP